MISPKALTDFFNPDPFLDSWFDFNEALLWRPTVMVKEFSVAGPFSVPTGGPSKNKWIDEERIGEFWDHEVTAGWPEERGCYVFALSTSRGAFVPIYVGRTSRRRFRAECLTPDKINKAHKGMRGRTGRLVLFLLSYGTSTGAPNQRVIRAAEEWLIKIAKETNPHLINKVGTRGPEFSIRGVYKSGVGKPSYAAQDFRRMLGFD